jgi:DNA-binding NarL/FixJ family response regulator
MRGVLVVSAFCGDPVQDTFRAGASGYLLKSDCRENLANALRTMSYSEPSRRKVFLRTA